MSQMGNLEKLGILVIVILVVVVGVVVITPKETLFPELPPGEIAAGGGDLLEPLPPPPGGESAAGDLGGPVDPFAPGGRAHSSDVAVGPLVVPPAIDSGVLPAVDPSVRPVVVGPAPADAGFREVTVQANDTFSDIAHREYGKRSLWPEIAKANPGVDAKRLRLGQKLRVPVLAASGGAAGVPAVDPFAPPAPAPAVVPPAVVPSATGRTYVVRRGDTLSDIAREQMGSVSRLPELRAANQDVLRGDAIRDGMILKIPGASAVPAKSTRGGASGGTTGDAKAYTVQKGDTLTSIASRMLGSSKRWREILVANESVLHGSENVREGMVLTIPADVAAR